MNRKRIATWLSLALAVMLGIEIGGGLFEARVIVPLWSANPPESVWNWNFNPNYQIRADENFWRFTTPLCGLIAVAVLLAWWNIPGKRATWTRIGAGMTLVAIAIRFLYFVPTLTELFGAVGRTMPPEQMQAKVEAWVALNWARALWYFGAWICTLYGLSRIDTSSRKRPKI